MNTILGWGLFLALAGITVWTAGGMLITMSMYRAGLALMASFVALAGLFILLDADLLAAIQVMMNIGGMLVMMLFMVMLMIDPGGEMMWDMKRKMHLAGPGALSMSMPRQAPPSPSPQGATTPAAGPSPVWTCPMHPEIRQDGPGQCPLCGMDLVPAAASAPAAGSPPVWTCPMHPEIRQDGPGQCPLCGMDLVPAAAEAPAPGAAGASVWTCPMHPEIRRDGPGQCPLCGMDLVPAEAPAAPGAGAAVWTCPMHPEIRQDGPGQCPLCGMNLVPAAAGAPAAGAPVPTATTGAAPRTTLNPQQHYDMMVGMAMSTAQLPWAGVVGAGSALALMALILTTRWPVVTTGPTGDTTRAVGNLLLSRYMIAFEGAAFLILAGIAGAVVFASRLPGLGPPGSPGGEPGVPAAAGAAGTLASGGSPVERQGDS